MTVCDDKREGAQEGESELRELLHKKINAALLCERALHRGEENVARDLNRCRRQLRRLENAADPFDSCLFEATDLTLFFMNLCYACDLALSGTGRRVLFGGEAASAFVCRETLMRLALNLISNAAVHSRAAVIYTSLSSLGSRALFTVVSPGEASARRLGGGLSRRGSGLRYAAGAAAAHGGAVLLCACNGAVKAEVSLQTSPALGGGRPVRDFAQLLCDRLSPVYTQLSTVRGI